MWSRNGDDYDINTLLIVVLILRGDKLLHSILDMSFYVILKGKVKQI